MTTASATWKRTNVPDCESYVLVSLDGNDVSHLGIEVALLDDAVWVFKDSENGLCSPWNSLESAKVMAEDYVREMIIR